MKRRNPFVYILGGLILLCGCVTAWSILSSRARSTEPTATSVTIAVTIVAPTTPPEPTVAAVGTPADQFVRAAFGDAWPFTVDTGLAICTEGRIVFTTGGKTYALNDAAVAAMKDGSMPHFQDVAAILADDAATGAKMSLAPILEAAQKLCG